MPDNPGDPAVTDPEATSADATERAAEEAATAQHDAAAEGEVPEDAAVLGDPEAEPVPDPAEETEAVDAEVVDGEVVDGEVLAEGHDAHADAVAGLEEALAEAEASEEETASAAADAELAERTEDLKRVTAEYANYRRRSERERFAAVAAAKASVVAELLPIVDDLRLAQQHGDLEDGPFKAFADKFHATLGSLGVEAFGEEGEAFNPEVHEAVQDLSSGDEKVLGTVLRQGYRLGERVIRTAMVVIADPA